LEEKLATKNPFVDKPDLAEKWELGYIAGFAEPETDHFLPLAPDFLESYQLGEQAGRDDRRLQPPEEQADGEHHEWGGEELLESALLHALGEGLVHLGIKAGGLITLILDVIQIPGDVRLKPLEPDWEGPVDQEGETYVALCGRTDHPMLLAGTVTDDGYWVGPQRETFKEAFSDRSVHQHPEAIVARCSLPDGTCGAVWPVK
jgi:hypothetical protein